MLRWKSQWKTNKEYNEVQHIVSEATKKTHAWLSFDVFHQAKINAKASYLFSRHRFMHDESLIIIYHSHFYKDPVVKKNYWLFIIMLAVFYWVQKPHLSSQTCGLGIVIYYYCAFLSRHILHVSSHIVLV